MGSYLFPVCKMLKLIVFSCILLFVRFKSAAVGSKVSVWKTLIFSGTDLVRQYAPPDIFAGWVYEFKIAAENSQGNSNCINIKFGILDACTKL